MDPASTQPDPVASDSSMPDNALAALTNAGTFTSVASFEALYRADFSRVVGLAYALTGNRQTAEEVTQEAFAAAYRRWATVGKYDAPGAWVRRVACNHAVSKTRRRVREARALVRLRAQQRDPVTLEPSDQAFWSAVRALPPRQAQAVALFYVEDLRVDTIAEILKCSEGTVKTHLSRARSAMAHELGHALEENNNE